MRPRSWLLATHIAHSTFFVFRIFIFNILIIHFSLRRQLAMVIFTRAFGCCGGETTFDSCSYSVRLCVRKSTHSFWWCVYLPHFTPFFLRRHLFHFIFSFISGTNYFSVFYDFFVRLWIVIIHTHTHIFHLRFVFFLSRRQQRFFPSHFLLRYIAAHNALMNILHRRRRLSLAPS